MEIQNVTCHLNALLKNASLDFNDLLSELKSLLTGYFLMTKEHMRKE